MVQLKITLLAMSLCSTLKANYCNIPQCSNPERHDNSMGVKCNKIKRSGLNTRERVEIVNAHNAIRKKMNAFSKLLEWDEELEDVAQKWANQCPETKDECRSTVTYPSSVVKQNLAVISRFQAIKSRLNVNFAEIIEKWSNRSNTPGNPRDESYKIYDRIGCGLTVTLQRTAQLPNDAGTYHFYLICNYVSSSELT